VNDRTPPHDHETEQLILGSILFDKEAHATALEILTGADFYQPSHEMIWNAAKALRAAGKPVDAVTVGDALLRNKELHRVGGKPYLADLLGFVVTTMNVDHHCLIVKDLSAQRRLIQAAERNVQDAWQSTDPIEAKVARAEDELRKVPTAEPSNIGNVMSLDEFCDQALPDNDWIIPGLLNRGDRLMLTGSEGLGKTVLMRQIAVCMAAGIHPFTMQPIQARTALFVDAENPTSIMVKSFGQMRANVRAKRGPIDEKRLWIERTPAGLDLGDPKDKLWLQRLVSLIRPDLLCIGPMYKLHGSKKTGQTEEDLARSVMIALDDIRTSVDCALVLEAHAGHGDSSAKVREMRPFGSSLWLRWPEFGFGIRAAEGFNKQNRLCDLVPWRGARDERDWPEQLAAGTNFLPWVDASYT